MAREWQPASSYRLTPSDVDEFAGSHLALAHPVSRNWSAARGAVLWEGAVDLAGSFPGFASWGSRARSVRLTLTDRFLLVDEETEYGFGLPIGWLSAALALTGVEPIALETGDHLRVCYLDGHQVRGFSLRVQGGRFGSRSGRRANQFRAAAISLGLASPTSYPDRLLPPEHDLSLGWDAFASYESEPVIWSGRAAMPIGSGLESALCDVWLTSASLIWAATSRAGIYRIATGSLAGITTAETPGHEPVIYWTVDAADQTYVDLPMIFGRPNRNDPDPATRESLIDLLEARGHRIAIPASPPQPWRAVTASVELAEPTVIPLDAEIPTLDTRGQPESEQSGTTDAGQPGSGGAIRPVDTGRRRLMDDGLFAERVPSTLPPSTPRPWGERVERVREDVSAARTSEEMVARPSDLRQPPLPPGSVVDRLRIWSPTATHRQAPPSGRDATAMLVRRPRVRATTTEEFLASEQAAHAARSAGIAASSIETAPDPRSSAARPTPPDRGVIVSFRRPRTAVAGLAETVHRAEGTAAARSTSSFATVGGARAAGTGVASGTAAGQPKGGESNAIVSDASSGVDLDLPSSTRDACDALGAPERSGRPLPGAATEAASDPQVSAEGSRQPDRDVATDRDSAAMSPDAAVTEAPSGIGQSVPDTSASNRPTHLPIMRSALSAIDAQLLIAMRATSGPAIPAGETAIAATAPFLAEALVELDAAVSEGELAPSAAETHRHAMTRSADTTERLRSLLELHAHGYLSAADLDRRCTALLGRAGILS